MQEGGEVASMPSLAASSSDTSPGEKAEKTSKSKEAGNGGSSAPVNSLLIAAMAMTEFQSRNAEKTSSDNGCLDSVKTEPPAQNEIRKVFRPSPKRRAEDGDVSCNVESGEAPPSEEGTNLDGVQASEASTSRSPLDPRELKRTRLVDVQKKMTWDQCEDDKSESKNEFLRGQETPKQKVPAADTLTPISARCIDFKKIHLSSTSPLASLQEKDDS